MGAWFCSSVAFVAAGAAGAPGAVCQHPCLPFNPPAGRPAAGGSVCFHLCVADDSQVGMREETRGQKREVMLEQEGADKVERLIKYFVPLGLEMRCAAVAVPTRPIRPFSKRMDERMNE